MECKSVNETPLISVIIPVYNGEKYVECAVSSVLNQPCADDVEVLLVNDGSTDHSGEICDLIAAKHNNVRVFHKKNGGVSSARNLGIDNVKGKYIAFLDCDDWWEKDFLNKEITSEFTGGADIYEFSYRKVNLYKNMERVYAVKKQTLTYAESGQIEYDCQHPCGYIHSAAFIKSSKLYFPLKKINEDTDFLRMALYKAKSLKRIDKVIFSYWENTASYLHSKTTPQRFYDIIEAIEITRAYYAFHGNAGWQDGWEMALMVAENLKRLCAESSRRGAQEFVDKCCNEYLANKPQKRLWAHCQRAVDEYNENPTLFWIKSKITVGIPIVIKRICYSIPGIRYIVNILFSKYVLKMTPIKEM